MEFYTRHFPGKSFTLFPLGDWHTGSRQFDEDFVRQVVKIIEADDTAYWVGMGDLLENAIVGSKSDVYTQTMPPREQMEHIVDLLTPIKKKGLFLIAGNHESRTMRQVGIQPETYIATRLDLPYMGFSCYANLFAREDQKGKRGGHGRGWACYFHHNYGGGYSTGGKVNRAEQLRGIVPTADAIFSGHFHITSRIPVVWYETGLRKIIRREGYDYITGSALTWNGSYAEERGKKPGVIEHIRVQFIGGTSGTSDNRQQVYGVISKKGER